MTKTSISSSKADRYIVFVECCGPTSKNRFVDKPVQSTAVTLTHQVYRELLLEETETSAENNYFFILMRRSILHMTVLTSEAVDIIKKQRKESD